MTTVAADYADRRWSQQKGMAALADLLAAPTLYRLPPIPWTVLTVGALLGRAGSAAEVSAWADFLAVQVTRSPMPAGTLTFRCDTHWCNVPVTIIFD